MKLKNKVLLSDYRAFKFCWGDEFYAQIIVGMGEGFIGHNKFYGLKYKRNFLGFWKRKFISEAK